MKKILKHTQIARKLRQNMTEAEKKFWFQVRNRRFENLKFKREHAIAPYTVDFYCEDYKLIVEIDGGKHNESESDTARDDNLKSRGFHVIRFWNNDVLDNIEGVMEEISAFVATPHPSKPSTLPPSPEGEGENQILIGQMRGAHGVKGLARVAVFVSDTSLFDTLTDYKIQLKNKHKHDVWLAHIDGINNKEEADALKGIKLYCDRTELSTPSDDEIYFADLVGKTCVDEDGETIGTILSVENYGAGNLFDIKPPQGQNFFISYDDETILKIEDKVLVRLPGII